MILRGLVKRVVKRLLTVRPSQAAYKFVLRDLRPLLELPHAAQVIETGRFTSLVRPIVMPEPPARRAVVLAPHPDDDAFGVGGALLMLADASAALRVIYLTDGPVDQVEGLHQDALASCAAVHADPVFLHLPLRNIGIDDAAVTALGDAVTDFAPDIVFTPFLLDDHDDHRRANHLFSAAFADGGLKAEIWAYQIYSTVVPNVVLDITAVAERKRELVRLWRHASGNRDWAHYVLGMNATASRYIPGNGEIYGEPYFVVPAAEYFDLCRRYFAAPPSQIYRGDSYRSG